MREHECDENDSSESQSIGLCAAVLSRRSLIEQPSPFTDTSGTVRGTDEVKVDTLESLVKRVSSRTASRGGESSPASTTDSTPRNRKTRTDQQPGPGVGKRSGVVDCGSLEIVEFEMEP